ncbi:MAG: AtpZ/AtpI family protein, partial [Candidatus Saccharimonas aalborgensis]
WVAYFCPLFYWQLTEDVLGGTITTRHVVNSIAHHLLHFVSNIGIIKPYMGKLPAASNSSNTKGVSVNRSASLVMIATMADTTWRMFVPTVGLIAAGDALDGRFLTRPWLMLTGALIGSLLAALLIKRQLQRGKA